MYSLASLGLGAAVMAAAEASEASATTGAFGYDPLKTINSRYGSGYMTRYVREVPTKSKATLKRRKANKLASKQRRSK